MAALRKARPLVIAVSVAVAIAGVVAQTFQGHDGSSYTRLEGGGWINEDTVRTARETAPHSITLPAWENPQGFEHDVFTFARVIFRSRYVPSNAYGSGRRLGWYVDYPDADLNLSYRLQQMTSLAVDPDARVLRLNDPDLPNYPLLFMVHVEGMDLGDDEIAALRKHLLAGGALFVTDFWGTQAWEHFKSQMKLVLPERGWTRLSMEHPIFRSIFQLEGPLNSLKVPTMQFWNMNADHTDPEANLSTRFRGEGTDDVHVWAMLDDNGRILSLVVHNTDISDGWERESENEAFFKTFSEPRAYPLAINIIFHLMTH